MRFVRFLVVALCAAGCGGGSPLSPGVDASGVAGAVSGAAGAVATGTAGAATGAAGAAGAATGTAGAAAGVAGSTGMTLPAINTGCGKPLPATQIPTAVGMPTGFTHFMVTATGATLAGPAPTKAGPRTFWVRVPVDYDPNHRYRVVYIGQGCGGYNVANTATLQLFSASQGGTEEAIYVALDIPTDMANQDCYDNRDGPGSQEWEAFELFHTLVDATYCVDNDNVFVAGYSTGGTLADQWGCYFAGDGSRPWNGAPGGNPPGTTVAPRRFAPQYHIRGQAADSGIDPDNNPPCNGPVAAFWLHDLQDTNPYASVHDIALPRVLKMNGCFSATPSPWHEDVMGKGVCVKYRDCPAAFPVVFCTTSGGGHSDQHPLFIPGVTLFFDEASAP